MITMVFRFLNVLVAALLAGVSVGIWIGFNPMNLSSSAYIEQQQNMLQNLRVLMIALVFLATLITIIAAFLQKKDKPTFVTLLIAALCFIACILITRFGNTPIDDVVLNLNSLPDNWIALRDKWWSLHIMRTIAELVALVLVIGASIRRN